MGRLISIPGLWVPRHEDVAVPDFDPAHLHGLCEAVGCGVGSARQDRIKNLVHFFDQGQLLAQWPLYGPGLVTDDSEITDPDDFSTVNWTRTNLTASDAHTLYETAVNNVHDIAQTLSLAAGPVESTSVDIEGIGRTWVELQIVGTGYAFFELSGAGTIGTTNNCTGQIDELTSEGHPGRYRCTIYPTVDSAASSVWRVRGATADGVNSYLGDVTKGYRLYNAQITQTSIVTAPNLYGAQMLALYGDRFDLTNATKASQPVLGATAWNGLPAAVFSGGNLLAADALGALYSGNDADIFNLLALQRTAAASGLSLFSLGNSADNNPIHRYLFDASDNVDVYRRDNAAASANATGATTIGTGRRVAAFRQTGGVADSWWSGAQDITGGACNVGTATFDQATLGCLRRIATSDFMFMVAREAAAGMLATDAQMLAASNYFMGRNPL